jgi:hypothetical protein
VQSVFLVFRESETLISGEAAHKARAELCSTNSLGFTYSSLHMKYPFLFSLLLLGSTLAAPAEAQQLPARPAHSSPLSQLPGLSSLAQRSTSSSVRKPGTAVKYDWDNSQWENAAAQTFTYDGRARLTLLATVDSATRSPQTNEISTYNAAGAITEVRYQSWNGTAYADLARLTLSYDTRNNLSESQVQIYNGSRWQTTEGSRFQNTYDAAGHLATQVEQRYNGTGYQNRARHVFTVPATGVWTAQATQRWRNNAWADTLRISNVGWHNFGQQQMSSADYEVLMNGSWLSFRLTGSYSATTEQRTMQRRVGSNFANFYRMNASYDAAGNKSYEKEESWNGTSWDIDREERDLLTYNASGDITRRISQANKTGAPNGLENIERWNYANFQTIALAARPQTLPAGTLQAYPNPSTDGRFVLQAALARPTAAELRVTDALGREVLRRTYSPTLDLSHLPAGLYLLELHTDVGVARQKVQVI